MHDAKLAGPVYAKRVVCGVSAAPLAPTRVRIGVLTCRLLCDQGTQMDCIAVHCYCGVCCPTEGRRHTTGVLGGGGGGSVVTAL